MVRSHIDTEGDPAEQTILNGVSEIGILEEGVRVAVLGLNLNYMIVRVLGDVDSVGVVRVSGLDNGNQILVKEQLADMSDMTTSEGVVWQNGRANMGDDVDVGGAAVVVTRKDGLELSNSLFVGLLNTTQKGLVEISRVISVSVHRAVDTGVDAGGVAVPHIPVQALDRLASVDIDELAIQNDGNAGLAVSNVRADELALDPKRSNFSLGGEQTDGVLGKKFRFRGVGSNVERRVVGSVHNLVGVAGVQRSLPVHVDNGSATGFRASIDTTTLQLIRASVEAPTSMVQVAPLADVGV